MPSLGASLTTHSFGRSLTESRKGLGNGESCCATGITSLVLVKVMEVADLSLLCGSICSSKSEELIWKVCRQPYLGLSLGGRRPFQVEREWY